MAGNQIDRVEYDAEIVAEIAQRLSTGEPLAVICRDEGMPCPNAVRNWMGRNPEVHALIARAREDGFDAIALKTLEIADTPVIGERTEIDADGRVKTIREDMLGHRKLQVETRLKLLAKWDPKRYGDRVQTTLTGADDGPVEINIAARRLLDSLDRIGHKK